MGAGDLPDGLIVGRLVLHTLLDGERSDVALYQRTERSLVDIPYEVVGEALSCSEAAVVELEHTLIVGLLDLCLGERIALGVLGIEEAGDRVTEGGEGVRLSCLQACEGLLLPGLEGLLIGARCGDREVE